MLGTGKEALQQLASGNIEGSISSILGGAESAFNAYQARGKASLGDDFTAINARSDALQNWCWYCLPPGIQDPNSVASPLVSLPWYYVQTTNLPYRTVAAESINMNGHPVHFPESYSVPELTMGFFLDSSNVVQQWLKAWQGQILSNRNPSDTRNQGMWNLPAQYKKTFNIVLMDVAKRTMLNVKYINCWPTSPSALDLTSASAEALIHNVTFHVEDMDFIVLNDKGIIDNVLSTVKGFAMSQISGAVSGASSSFASALNKF